VAIERHRAVDQDVKKNAQGPAVHLPEGEIGLEGGKGTVLPRPPPRLGRTPPPDPRQQLLGRTERGVGPSTSIPPRPPRCSCHTPTTQCLVFRDPLPQAMLAGLHPRRSTGKTPSAFPRPSRGSKSRQHGARHSLPPGPCTASR